MPAKKKSTVNKAGNYTKPAMRKRLFNKIKAGSKGGKAGHLTCYSAPACGPRCCLFEPPAHTTSAHKSHKMSPQAQQQLGTNQAVVDEHFEEFCTCT